jgi:hypothetical protein
LVQNLSKVVRDKVDDKIIEKANKKAEETHTKVLEEKAKENEANK